MAVNYGWWSHGTAGGVHVTASAVDGARVFSTFGEARRALGDHFSAIEREAAAARYRARNLKKADERNGEWVV
jgi:hypothetical protein